MTSSWQFFVDDKQWMGERSLYIRRRAPDGSLLSVVALQMDHAAPGLVVAPALTETREAVQDNAGDVTGFLQAALETAWALGLRPPGFADHSNELTAVRYHLEDMRHLAKVKR